jgi:hypothetical protein
VPQLLGWPVDFLVIIPALILGLMIKIKSGVKLVKIPQYSLLMALLLIILVSDAVNGYMDMGIQEFILFFKKACIFFMIILLVNTPRKLKNTMFFMGLLSCVIAVQAVSQFISGGIGIAGQDFYHSGVGVRTKWVGLWNGANAMSLLLNITVPFAMEFSFGHYSLFFRVINFLLCGCMIAGIYTTNSRGGFLTLIISLLLYPMLKLRNKKFAIIIGVLLAGVMLVYFAPSRMSQISTQEASVHERTRLWSNAIECFKENMLFGVGKGRYIQVTSRHMLAHSNFMQNLAEIGGIGIFVWVALIYFSFKGLRQIYKLKVIAELKEENITSLGTALMVSLIGLNVSTLFVTNEIDIFYLLLGLCAAAVNILHKSVQEVDIKFTWKDAMNVLSIVVIMSMYYYSYIIK